MFLLSYSGIKLSTLCTYFTAQQPEPEKLLETALSRQLQDEDEDSEIVDKGR